MESETVSFFDTLFGGALNTGELRLLIWSLPSKKSYWYRVEEGAANIAAELCAAKEDVYFGVCLAGKDHGPICRCPADEVAAAVCLWADVDYADEVHKKPGLPTRDQAEGFLRKMPLRPSIIVSSGHGFQSYWLFKEPLEFNSPEENRHFQRFSAAWGAFLQSEAGKQGFTLDSVHDLARVLRVPGTINYKGLLQAPVRHYYLLEDLTSDSSAAHPLYRYNPSDFDDYILPFMDNVVVSDTLKGEPLKGSRIALDPNAKPDTKKFDALVSIEPKFAPSYYRSRKDLKDPSPSGYDMALASFAAQCLWTDQEVADLLISSRRLHGDDLKLREDYYIRTIAKARQSVTASRAGEILDSIGAECSDPTEKRVLTLTKLSEMFKIRISQITKYKSEQKSEYHLVTDLGGIEIGEIENLTGQVSFRNRMADATGVWLPKFKNVDWDKIVQALLDSCTLDTSCEFATIEGRASAWIQAYLDQSPPVTENVDLAAEARRPFVKGGYVFFFGDGLRSFILHRLNEPVGVKQLGIMLRKAGCSVEKIHITVANKKTTRYVWRYSDPRI